MKLKSLLQAILYVTIVFAVIFVLQIGMGIVIGAQILLGQDGQENFNVIFDYITSNGNFSLLIQLLIFEIILGIFLVWYTLSRKSDVKYCVKEALSGRNILCAIVIGVFLQVVINPVMSFISIVMPDQFDEYVKLSERVMGSEVSPILIFLTIVVVGPLAEEIVFRGMIYRVLRKGFGFAVSAVITSFIFSIYHMNFVQALYVFIVSWVLCVVYERTKSFWLTAILHISFNGATFGLSWGLQKVDSYIQSEWISNTIFLLLWAVSTAVVFWGIPKIRPVVRCHSENEEMKINADI